VLPKRSLRSPPTESQEKTYKKAENRKPRGAVADGTAVQGRTTARATTHGRASRQGHAPHPAGCAWPLPRVHGRAPLSHARALYCFPLLCYP